MKKWRLKEKYNFAKEYINKKYTSIKRKIKNKTKILYLRAMQRNSIKIKKELELITKIANASSDLLKITSLASIIIMVISFIIYNYFYFMNFKEIPKHDNIEIIHFGIINIIAFLILLLVNYVPMFIVMIIKGTLAGIKINISNKLIDFIAFFICEILIIIAFLFALSTLILGITFTGLFETIGNNLTNNNYANKIILPIVIFIVISLLFIYTKIHHILINIIWICTITIFIFNLNFNFYSILGLGKYKADIIVSQNDLSFSYILKKYKQTHKNNHNNNHKNNVIPKCENQERVCILDDGRLSINNVEILFDSGSVIHVENIYNPSKVLKIKSENIDIEKIDRQNNKSSEINNESKKQNEQDLEKSKENNKEEDTTKNN